MKSTIKLEDITKGLPTIILDYFKYLKTLQFKDRPDYKSLIAQFKSALKNLNYIYDRMFDWKVQKIRKN